MVHGTALLLRRVLVLKKPIDYFDQFLSVMKPIRHKMNLLDNGSKIEVFGGRYLDKRFDECAGSRQVFENFEHVNFKDESNSKWLKSNGVSEIEHKKWNTVFFYSSQKFDVTLPERLAALNKERPRTERRRFL